MSIRRSNITVHIIIISSFSLSFFSSCKEEPEDGTIVFTQIATELQDTDYISGSGWRYMLNSSIATLNINKPAQTVRILTDDYFSACAPDISYDGNFMIFAGQKRETDIWQIYEMNLSNLKTRQITSSTEDCIDPTYLPGNRFVFSKLTENTTVKKGHMLFTCNLDRSEIKQITFNPHTYFGSTILKDGRVLTIGRQLYPNQKDEALMVMRPDGSKQELFYKGAEGSGLKSGGLETNNGNVIFIESNGKKEGDLISINYSRPLNSRVNLSTEIKGSFYSVKQLNDNKFLTTYRSSTNNRFALYEFDLEAKKLGGLIYKDDKHNILEAVLVKPYKRPRKLPSEVNVDKKTGLLMCQDVNFTDMHSDGDSTISKKASKIAISGVNSSLGTVDVEEDGSFYLKVAADMPFRITALDDKGNVVNGPGSWLYLRPNERRGCVGCHESNELAPFNRQPLSIRKDPVIIPMPAKEIHKVKDSLK